MRKSVCFVLIGLAVGSMMGILLSCRAKAETDTVQQYRQFPDGIPIPVSNSRPAQEMTRADATAVIASLSNSQVWVAEIPPSGFQNWITGFKRDHSEIEILSSWPFENPSKVYGVWIRRQTMQFKVLFPHFCGPLPKVCSCDMAAVSHFRGELYCGVMGTYTLTIESPTRVSVDGNERWPRVPNMTAPGKFHFEYTQFR
jgi:hypothetical protein